MNEYQIKMVLTGLAWGAWPIILRKSGLNGSVNSAAFSLVVLAVVTPFAISTFDQSLADANWKMICIAGLLGACGMLLFNSALAKAPEAMTGMLFVTMMMVQIAVPAVYRLYLDGTLTRDRAIGFGAAFVAAFFLNR